MLLDKVSHLWITKIIGNTPSFKSIANVAQHIVDIVQEKDFMKINLNESNKQIIENLFVTTPKYIDYVLAQIEPNPDKIQYITHRTPVKYIYNINYFPTNTDYPNKKCRKINPEIAKKLITADTINAKNSDDNTPLHLAIVMAQSDLVELLISRGAIPRSFPNLHGQTPHELIYLIMKEHLELTNNQIVIQSIINFVVPFNDLLIDKLMSDRYSNNIIKNISYGIPIQLIMYNHMFHLFWKIIDIILLLISKRRSKIF